ncbi:MAG TPA: hypothetical protein PLG34_04670 [Spirochaetota bacterium]|jgi:hypothetical protein|nr:hypothetical protein [Spirochaetota bacterium]HPY87255.1 hypothetical protein [Spirochaetota bacterium]HQB60658.1 hypothetical protein [Spirochaetota bacterium]
MRIYFLAFATIILAVFSYGIDNSGDYNAMKVKNIFDEDYKIVENLRKHTVIFDAGGELTSRSRVAFGKNLSFFEIVPNNGGFKPVPDNMWIANFEGEFWGRITFFKESYLHFRLRGLFKFEKESIVPMFNVEELYIKWRYPIGSVVIGRTYFSLKSALIFSGPLDALELNIEVPFLNFKTFIGYTGLLGLFHPWFNPYGISEFDRTFVENTNLLTPKFNMAVNEIQARRVFIATDFDINVAAQHINPYLLGQIDVSSAPIDKYNNNKNAISTFHMGLNLEGRIIENFYYAAHISGMFGASQDIAHSTVDTLMSFAFTSQLRYTFVNGKYSTFILSYSFGYGDKDSSIAFWSDDYNQTSNKFYYYGKFDGGFVLSPILSNIHSVSLKYLVTPVDNLIAKFTIYLAGYQTFKFFPSGEVSDPDFKGASYLVGAEADFGFIVNVAPSFTLSVDSGIFFPENTSEFNPRIKLGASIVINI